MVVLSDAVILAVIVHRFENDWTFV